jgi:hypothetical protein
MVGEVTMGSMELIIILTNSPDPNLNFKDGITEDVLLDNRL